MAEASDYMTAYQYALKNPLMFNDPNGDVAQFTNHRIGSESGNHWSNGMQYSDWTLYGGSATYGAGLEAGF